VVRAMHAKGGVFEHTGNEEALEGLEARLHIGDAVVRRVTVLWAFGAPNIRNGLRIRLQKAAPDDVLGVRQSVGAHAFDAMNRVRPFAESSIIAMKQALSWYLLACCGWPSVRMPGRGMPQMPGGFGSDTSTRSRPPRVSSAAGLSSASRVRASSPSSARWLTPSSIACN
jgi:hypothetical protein